MRARAHAIGAALGAVVGGTLGWLTFAVTGDGGPQSGPDADGYFIGDRVQQAVTELADDNIWVAPDGRSMVSVEEEAALAKALAEHDGPPVAIVVWAPSRNAGYRTAYDASRQIQAEHDPNSIVVLWEGPRAGNVEAPVGTYLWHDLEFSGAPAKRLTEFIAGLSDDSLDQRDTEEELDRADRAAMWGVAGVVGPFIGVGLFAVTAWVLNRRRGKEHR